MSEKESTPPPVPPSPEQPPKRPGPHGTPPPMQGRGILAWMVLFGALLMMGLLYRNRHESYEVIPYRPDFVGYVQEGRVSDIKIVNDAQGTTYVQGYIKPLPGVDSGTDAQRRSFRVNVPPDYEPLARLLDEHSEVGFDFSTQNPVFLQMLYSFLPALLIFGLLYFVFMRQMRAAGGALSFGKSRAKLLSRETHKITFENVAGVDEAKEEVQEIIDFLKDPKRFQTLGGRIPKGVLLMGPPGTGKTLLAKAIAGEADVPFFSISGSDFVEMFVGVGASRVRDMFEQGKRNAPCIIFIDEIDAVGRSRFTGIGGGHDEREQTLNALLVEMDGFETQEGVIIIAATNRPDVLDPALLRPGRFDRQIVIDLPTVDGREAILKMHSRKIKLSIKADLRRLARGTPGFSGADLENILNEAALLAARQGKDSVENNDLDEARDKVKWGRERRSQVLDEKEKRITAYHETGHALVACLVEESEPLHKVTIIPRGVAYLGATMHLPEKDRYMEGRRKLKGLLATLMGGRATEALIFGDITSGASSDLKEATRLARLMVCNWGMSSEMGPRTFGDNQEIMFLGREVSRNQDYSDETARRIDAEVDALLHEAYQRAETLLKNNRKLLDEIAEKLLEEETLDGRDVEDLVKYGRIRSEEEREVEEAAKRAADTPRGKPEAEDAAEKETEPAEPATEAGQD